MHRLRKRQFHTSHYATACRVVGWRGIECDGGAQQGRVPGCVVLLLENNLADADRGRMVDLPLLYGVRAQRLAARETAHGPSDNFHSGVSTNFFSAF